MTLEFHVTGSKRKQLAYAIGTWLGAQVRYLGPPTFAYETGAVRIERDGMVTLPESLQPETLETLLQHLTSEGFAGEPVPEQQPETCGVCISFPRAQFTDGALENLRSLIRAKGRLIKKALGVPSLPITVTDDSVSFPWFTEAPDSDKLRAYNHFLCALCRLAQNAKRITAREKEVDNEKYAFRCFLLRLGFIGSEYKADRKTLLKNMTGSSAFKNGGVSHDIL